MIKLIALLTRRLEITHEVFVERWIQVYASVVEAVASCLDGRHVREIVEEHPAAVLPREAGGSVSS